MTRDGAAADETGEQAPGGEERGAFEFTGDWRQFAPIAFTNLLLSIVTLGLYLFWARTRERRYLWSHTRFIDDRLEWTGTGRELAVGYGLAVIVFGLPLAIIQFGLQALALRGHVGAATLIGTLLYLMLLLMTGIAIFRALRYRLSRTFWHGIRGGSDDQGVAFGLQYLWRTLLGTLALGLLIPWSMVSLWNLRWDGMSFGGMRFAADARVGPVFKRFLLFYLIPVFLFVLAVVLLIVGVGLTPTALAKNSQSIGVVVIAFVLIGYLGFFGVLGLVALTFYAAYFREVVGRLTLGDLEFEFTAGTWDWVRLVIGNGALIFLTFGIGYIFVGYRNWTFFIRHMRAYGEVRLDTLRQSRTREPGQGEGLLDAFDIGAF